MKAPLALIMPIILAASDVASFNFNVTEKQIKIRAKSFTCEDVDPSIVPKYICKLKPTRDGRGRFTLQLFNVTELNDIWLNVVVSIRMVTQFHPIGVDIDVS